MTSSDNTQGKPVQYIPVKKKIKTVIILLVFAAFSGLLAVKSWTYIWDAGLSKHWPTTNGDVISSKVESTPNRYSYSGFICKARIRYAYSVDGIGYVASKISFDPRNKGTEKEAKRCLNQYPVGKTIVVYYNPDNPHIAVLDTSVSVIAYIIFCLSIIFAVLSLFVVWMLRK